MPKPSMRQIHFSAADRKLDQIIISAAVSDNAKIALFVERLKNRAGVIGQTANDVIIHLHKFRQAARGRFQTHQIQFGGQLAGIDEIGNILEV